MTDLILEALRTAALPNTEILEVTAECGTYLNLTDLPPFVRVRLRTSFGPTSEIFTEMWLPDEWNHRFTAHGNGGMAGGLWCDCMYSYLKRGCATIHTDMGTHDFRTRGIHDPEVWRDFGQRSTHMMAVLGKSLIRLRYGEDPKYSYFIGVSTGGNQALKLVQEFPDDYDGVIAGVPAHNRAFLHLYGLWGHNNLVTADGVKMFSDEQIPRITEAAVAFFQMHGDGEVGDNFVSFPYVGRDTVAQFLAFLRTREPEFTDRQIEALRRNYEGPRDPVTGRQIYNGVPIGAEIYACGIRDNQNFEAPFFEPFRWVFGEDYTGYDFDFHRDSEIFYNALTSLLSANDPDLSAFFSHGGKLLSYSAASDPCVPFPDAMAYCERVWQHFGGYDKVCENYRWFLLPGADHGNGGNGVNALWVTEEEHDIFTALCRWVEEEEAPAYLTGARVVDGEVKFTRRLYPYGSEQFPQREHMPTCDEYYLSMK